jgi:hypothetical protein
MIENSTLSLEETEKILLEIELDRYVSPREIFEAKNLERVMRYINKNTDKNVLNTHLSYKYVLIFPHYQLNQLSSVCHQSLDDNAFLNL